MGSKEDPYKVRFNSYPSTNFLKKGENCVLAKESLQVLNENKCYCIPM